jgi:WD40 repeat protein
MIFRILLIIATLSSLLLNSNFALAQRPRRSRPTDAVKVSQPSRKEVSTDKGSSFPTSTAGSYTKMSLLRTLIFDAPVIAVKSVAFSPDNKTIAGIANTGSFIRGKTVIKLWDSRTGGMKRTLSEDSVWSDTVSFSPDGKTLATGDRGAVKLWDTQTWQVKRTLTMPLDPQGSYNSSGSVISIAFSFDSNLLIGLIVEMVCLWDTQTGNLIWKHAAPPPENDGAFPSWWQSVAFSPDGQTVAVGGGIAGSAVRFYEVKTGAILGTWKSVASNLTAIAYSPDGRMLAVGGGSDGTLPGSLGIWDVASGKLKVDMPLDFDGGYVRSFAFSPDGKTIVSGSDDKVRLWEVETGKLKLTLPSEGAESVAWSPDGKMLVVGNSKRIRLWIERN